MPSYRWTI